MAGIRPFRVGGPVPGGASPHRVSGDYVDMRRSPDRLAALFRVDQTPGGSVGGWGDEWSEVQLRGQDLPVIRGAFLRFALISFLCGIGQRQSNGSVWTIYSENVVA